MCILEGYLFEQGNYASKNKIDIHGINILVHFSIYPTVVPFSSCLFAAIIDDITLHMVSF
jgi:hypothetical protein